ncbi:branched-chain amino acid ABC transporter substrate-binding protein [Jiella sp. M17.18]|uniref:branched-chain amino acid ABC transporter substrate-binding protein n=1 Tax=Jiella sp. M17.18 TaxID=3234247 RepID=UPI0034DE1AF5
MLKLTKILTAGAVAALMSASAAYAAGTITIGVQVPTTGSEATYGKDMANAVSIAQKEINAKGGVLGKKLEMIVGDSACDPQQSVNAAAKLVSQKVVAVVGGYCSGATVPTLKIYGDANVPFVITAANSTDLIPQNPGNAFMINSTGDEQAKKAVDFLSGKGVKTLAIVNEGDAYSQNLADLTRDAWKKAGNKVVAYETVNKGEQDYSAIVTAIKAANPDAVFWTAYYADGGLLIRQLRQSGYQGKIAVGDGSNSSKLFDIAGRAAEGVYAFSNPIAEFLPKAKDFIKTYKKDYGSAPGPYAPLTYDGMRLVAWAIDKAGSTKPDAIEKALASADNQEWLAGPISFTKKNTLARSNFIVLEGKGGAWTRADK